MFRAFQSGEKVFRIIINVKVVLMNMNMYSIQEGNITEFWSRATNTSNNL